MALYRFCRLKLVHRNPFTVLFATKSTEKDANYDKISAWQIHSYGDLEELQYSKVRSPVIRNPNDVVIQVLAASVNPLDIAMINGYGSVFLNFMRQVKSFSLKKQIEFPLTLGRDFAGVVIGKGHSVKSKFDIGEEVWGIVPPSDQGSHAKQVTVCKKYVQKKPKNISMVEAGSMLYAAVTAWSALKITGDLAILESKGKTALVLGGSGGVGTMAVQMLKNWGTHVTTTCNADAIPLLQSLGIRNIIDYNAEDSLKQIGCRKYDIILDCAGIGEEKGVEYSKYLKEYSLSKYITLKSPLLHNIDEYGMIGGTMKGAGDLLFANITTGILPKFSSIRWGFFIPLEEALREITEYVQKGKLLPCIQKKYSFQDLPKAYKQVSEGHLRGKIVIDMSLGRDNNHNNDLIVQNLP